MFAVLTITIIFAGILMAFGMPVGGAVLFGAVGTGAVLYFIIFKDQPAGPTAEQGASMAAAAEQHRVEQAYWEAKHERETTPEMRAAREARLDRERQNVWRKFQAAKDAGEI